MKIKYNEIEKSIEIKDGLKSQYFIMKFLIVVSLINAILNLYNVSETGWGFLQILWLIFGIVFIVFLHYFIMKKSTLEKIPIKKIKKLKEKSVFGRKSFSLELINGKSRDLAALKTQTEFNELRKLFDEIGMKS